MCIYLDWAGRADPGRVARAETWIAAPGTRSGSAPAADTEHTSEHVVEHDQAHTGTSEQAKWHHNCRGDSGLAGTHVLRPEHLRVAIERQRRWRHWWWAYPTAFAVVWSIGFLVHHSLAAAAFGFAIILGVTLPIAWIVERRRMVKMWSVWLWIAVPTQIVILVVLGASLPEDSDWRPTIFVWAGFEAVLWAAIGGLSAWMTLRRSRQST